MVSETGAPSEIREAVGHASGRGSAKAIGVALVQNREAIDLASAGLSILIDDKLTSLRLQRLNSPEAQAEIAKYEDLQQKLGAIRDAAANIPAEVMEDSAVVDTAISFTDALGNWWTRRHIEAFDMGLFLSGLGICSLLGSSGPVIAGICGAIVGGKQVADVIKSFGEISKQQT